MSSSDDFSPFFLDEPNETEDESKHFNNVRLITSEDDTSNSDRRIRFGEKECDDSQPSADYTYRPSIRLSQAIPRMECENFLNAEDLATIVIDKIIKEATTNEIVKEAHRTVNDDTSTEDDSNTTKSSSSTSSYSNRQSYGGAAVFIIEWPSIIEFTEDLGVERIDDFLSYWYFENDWKYAVFFVDYVCDECSDIYRYQAIFSIPCRQYPIPHATASVYFKVEASRVRPKYCPVVVSYHFEGKRLLHIPGGYEFQEKWLFDIIESKIKLFKSLKF